MTSASRDSLRFTKMHGAGNDYVYVETFSQDAPAEPASLARRISDRHRGVGGDGLILIRPCETADAALEIYNADGSRAEMCGNGLRCAAARLFELGGRERRAFRIATDAGLREVSLLFDGQDVVGAEAGLGPVALDGSPAGRLIASEQRVADQTLRLTAVWLGNPHCVLWVDAIGDADVAGLGSALQASPLFPEGVNVSFAEQRGSDAVRQRTFERGSAETRACGTGAAAVTVAGVLEGRTGATVRSCFAGGELETTWPGGEAEVRQRGPVATVFDGVWREGVDPREEFNLREGVDHG